MWIRLFLFGLIAFACLSERGLEAKEPERPDDMQMADKVFALDASVRELLGKSDIALTAVSDILERNPNTEDIIVHGALKRYADKVKGLRAIIVTDSKGFLKYDSFSFPARELDLSDRHYIKAARLATGREFIIANPVIGRTSGIPFVPVSRPIFADEKADRRCRRDYYARKFNSRTYSLRILRRVRF